jgi:F-type H+-transporting ATPase subunit gamma
MSNLRDLKSRIASIKSIKQITNAMKMVAAAKLRKAQDSVITARPYINHVNYMLRSVEKKHSSHSHPIMVSKNPYGIELLIIVTSDRGLCGSFNSSIIKYAIKYLDENPNCDLLFLGKKGYDFFFKKGKYNVLKFYPSMTEEINFESIADIKRDLVDLYYSGKYAKVFVIYNEFKSAIQQNLVHNQILPVIPVEDSEISSLDYLYEPDVNYLIEELGIKYMNVELWRILLESCAAEQGARMTAMDNATTNAGELIEDLSLIYNRERQSQITTQIIEVASGAEAISN